MFGTFRRGGRGVIDVLGYSLGTQLIGAAEEREARSWWSLASAF